MNKDKRNNIQLLGTLNNSDESGIIANANQVYDANEDKSTQDVSKEHKERIETLETKESSMQTTLENIAKTGEASAASNVTYNHNDSNLDSTNVQQAIDEVRKRSNYNDGDNIIDFNSINLITNSSRYIYALVDSNENLILGILRSNGHIVYGNGIPDEVKDYIDNQINKILGTDDISSTIDSLKEIENFLKDFSNSDTLKVLLDRQNSKIEDVLKRSNPNTEDGDIVNTKDIMSFVKSEKYVWALLDSNDNFVVGINRSNGKIEYGNGIPKEVEEKINEAIDITNKYSTNSVNNLSDIIFKTFGIKDTNGEFLTMSTLLSVVDSKKYLEAKLDGNDNVIYALDFLKGIFKFFLPLSVQGTEFKVTSNDKYVAVLLDGNDNILIGIKRKGLDIEYGGDIPSAITKKFVTKEEYDKGKEEYDKKNVSDIQRQSIEDYNLPIPSYWRSFLDKKIDKINETILNINGYKDSFVFITDVHIPNNAMQSPKLIKYILRNSLVKKVFFGGDVPGGNYDDAKSANIRNVSNFVTWLCKPLAPYCSIYCANGNHDFGAAAPNWDYDKSYMAPLTMSRFVYLNTCTEKNVVFNKEDAEGVYYYFDNTIEKIRYIVINTNDKYGGEHNKYVSNNNSFSKTQSDWIAENAIKTTPNGYKLIIFGHVPPTSPYESHIPSLQSYLNAIVSKSKVTINETEYDFTNAPDILLTIWGHMHRDEVTYIGGFPTIVLACDASYSDYRRRMFGDYSTIAAKEKGTIYEQTFDVIIIDEENLITNFIRIGGGYDRKVHNNVLTLKVGENLKLTTDIENPIWEIADGEGNEYGNDRIVLSTTIATVDNGTVTGLKAGYSTVSACNNNTCEMEWWGIKVID